MSKGAYCPQTWNGYSLTSDSFNAGTNTDTCTYSDGSTKDVNVYGATVSSTYSGYAKNSPCNPGYKDYGGGCVPETTTLDVDLFLRNVGLESLTYTDSTGNPYWEYVLWGALGLVAVIVILALVFKK